MTQSATLVIKVDIREDAGIYYASSPDLMGLHLRGPSKEKICESVVKTVKALFKHNRQMDVDVTLASADIENFPSNNGACDMLVVRAADDSRFVLAA